MRAASTSTWQMSSKKDSWSQRSLKELSPLSLRTCTWKLRAGWPWRSSWSRRAAHKKRSLCSRPSVRSSRTTRKLGASWVPSTRRTTKMTMRSLPSSAHTRLTPTIWTLFYVSASLVRMSLNRMMPCGIFKTGSSTTLISATLQAR
jgi:hypothetical protein